MEKKPEIKNGRPPKSAAEEDTSSEEDEDYESAKSIIGTCCEKILDQYDFSVKYEPSKSISSFESCSDSSTSDSSWSVCSEAESVAEEAQTDQKEKTLAGPEKIMQEEPEIKNETPLKPAAKEDTDSEEDEDYESAKSIIGTCCEKILDQYDFSVKYEPSKSISSFECYSDSSTSDSSWSVCSEAETVVEEAQSQKEKTLAGLENLGFRSSPEVMAEGPEIKNGTLLEEENAKTVAQTVLVKQGVKRLAEGGDKNSKRAKEMDDLNEGERD